MKGKIQVILVLLIFAGALVGIGVLTYSNRVGEIDTEFVKTVKLEKTPVQVQVATPRSLTEKLVATGVLRAEQDVVLSAEVGGRVKKVTKSLGDLCEKGALFVKVDAENYQLAVQQAKAGLVQAEVNLTYAEREWQRMAKLKKSEVVSASRIDGAEGTYSASKAAVATAKTAVALAARNLRETSVRCPFTGYVAERMVDPGATISPGLPLARLVDTHRLTVTLSVASDKLARLKVGGKTVLSDPALPGRRYDGSVLRLGVAADSRTRTFPVEITLEENQGGGLHAGQVVEVSLALQTYDDVIAVPAAAVQKRDGAPFVLVVKNGRVKTVPVEQGPAIEQNVIIEKGLKIGDEVIVIGFEDLTEGAAVEITGKIPVDSQEPKSPTGASEPESAAAAEKS